MQHLVSYFEEFNRIRGTRPRHEKEWRERWIDGYRMWRDRNASIYTIMALIHPDFDTAGKDLDEFEDLAEGPCQIHQYVHGMNCPSENKNEVVQFENDHSWPRSLGGRTVEGNRKTLCKYCNGMKGDNPHFWDNWDDNPPTWVRELLDGIFNRIDSRYYDED